jgi:hypothetical protein
MKFKKESDNIKYTRIKMDVGNPSEKYVTVQLTQSFDYLQFLSLKLSDTDIYRVFNADYGVVAGRVLASEGVGLPNCRVSIFIPKEEGTYDSHMNMVLGDIEKTLYPYESVSDENEQGLRYNLLPAQSKNQGYNGFPINPYSVGVTPKVPVGSFGDKEEVLTNPIYLEVYKKYYKYSTVTNESGDYMLFGVPTGNHIIHMDCDLTDIGRWSLSPSIMSQVFGYPESLFTNNGTTIKKTTDLSSMPHIRTLDVTITVKSLWSQLEDKTEIGITRQDFKISTDIAPYVTVFGAGFTMGADAYIGDFYKNKESGITKDDVICGGLYNRTGYKEDTRKTWLEKIFQSNNSNLDEIKDRESKRNTEQEKQPDYVVLYNGWIRNNTPINDVTNSGQYPFKDWLNNEINTDATFMGRHNLTMQSGLRDFINAKRRDKGNSTQLVDAFNELMVDASGNPVFSNQILSKHIYFTKNSSEDQVYYKKILAGDLSTVKPNPVNTPSGNLESEHEGDSYLVREWTSKFNFKNFRDGIIKVKVFTFKETVSNTQITSGDNKIDIRRDITMLREGEFAIHTDLGVFSVQVPCNRTRVITAEDGTLIPSPDPSKGIFSEFGGYMIFETDGDIRPIDIETNTRADRVRIKVPQETGAYSGNEVSSTYNEDWVRKGYIFNAGDVYSVAQHIYSSSQNYEAKIGMIVRPNELIEETGTADGGVRLLGFPANTVYNKAHPTLGTSTTQVINIQTFENEWLNFCLYFPQYQYKILSLDGMEFGSQMVVGNKFHQVIDNQNIIGGNEKNSKGMLNGSYFQTAFVKVDKRDFIHFYAKEDHGFTSRYLPLKGDTLPNYKSNGDIKYFYAGRSNNVFKFLQLNSMI